MVVEWVGGGWYRDILSIRKLHFLKLNTHLNRDFLIFKKAQHSFGGSNTLSCIKKIRLA